MKIYHIETQQDYDALMSELEEKGCEWLSGYKPTEHNYWEENKEDSCIIILGKYIAIIAIEQCKKQHPSDPIIKYKSKGENMVEEEMKQEEMKQEEMKQEEMKHNIIDWARDVSIAVESFSRDMSEAEADLKEAKTSAKKLIENIDEYLETLKPKFKVGDYVTFDIPSNKKIAKIDSLNGALHGLWYDRESEIIEQDFYFNSGNKVRHARPTEIAEYEAALTFHKHGRNPFEVKKGDILRDDKGNILINDDNVLSADFPKNLKKHYFTSGKYTFLKTVEEYNEWLGADDEKTEK